MILRRGLSKEDYEGNSEDEDEPDTVPDTDYTVDEKGDMLHIYAGQEVDERNYLLEPKHRLMCVTSLPV